MIEDKSLLSSKKRWRKVTLHFNNWDRILEEQDNIHMNIVYPAFATEFPRAQ